MSIATTIKTLLQADAALTTILTGGVYSIEETGRDGISRAATPNAYNPPGTGYLRPCALVRPRNEIPQGDYIDFAGKVSDYRQVIEVWLYTDGDTAYTALEQARSRIYALLHFTRIDGYGWTYWAGGVGAFRDSALGDANALRIDFTLYSIKRGA